MFYVKIAHVTRFKNHAFVQYPIGTCHVYTTGDSCSIGTTSNYTTTVATALGAKAGFVNGTLGLNFAWSSGTSIGCTSPPLKAGTSWSAYPFGEWDTYKIEWVAYSNGAVTRTSGLLSAHEPYPGHIACQ